jgi:hypothetical protein
MVYNQLDDFLDTLDTSIIRHIVMFYEEPEYAKLVQMRFLDDGLNRGECCVYAARDEGDLLLTKREMADQGIDIDKYIMSGLLQFYIRKPHIIDTDSYKKGREAFQGAIVKQFASSQEKNSTLTVPKIRGVGSIYRDIFSTKESKSSRYDA